MNYKEYKLRNINVVGVVEEIIEVENMTFKNRTSSMAHQRYFLMHFLRNNTTLSLTTIGRLFDRDHATVMNGLKRHDEFIEYNDTVYKQNVASIKNYLEEILIK